jgi:hypothetical protein
MICNREQIFWFLADNLEGFHIHVMYPICLSQAIFLKDLALLFQYMYNSLFIACKIAITRCGGESSASYLCHNAGASDGCVNTPA